MPLESRETTTLNSVEDIIRSTFEALRLKISKVSPNSHVRLQLSIFDTSTELYNAATRYDSCSYNGTAWKNIIIGEDPTKLSFSEVILFPSHLDKDERIESDESQA